jgi:PAS domain S-box-containing protein
MSKSEPIRILYMEDDPGLARLFRKRLERAGYVVDLAPDGEEGLTMYETGSYDVLAVDQVMPVREGLEVIRILSSRGPMPPIVMVTGTGSEEIAVEAMKLGASDYVVKDVDGGYLDLLPTVIEQALRRHRLAEEKQQAEEALRVSEARYRSLFDGVPTGLYRTTPEGKILDANPALVEMLGLESREALLSANTADFYADAEDREQWKALMEKEGSVRGFELQMRRSDGTLIWVRENTQADRDADGRVRYYDGNMEDITERKMLEIQLREAQKMRTVGQLAGGIAHNYNNLLTVIQGNTQLVLMAVREDERLRDGLDEVLKASKRAARLTAQLLTFGRQERTEFSLLDLNTVIHNVLEKLNRLLGENISLFTDLEPRLSTTEEDVDNIERIIENLVVNAREAMPEGGEITIATENVRVDRKYCAAHPEAQRGRFVCLSVRDTGVGMSKDSLGRIFEPFFSTKDFSEGAGLGLSVVYGIVRPHGGWIAVESAPGEGALFKVYLPAVSVKAKEEDQ